MKNKVKIMGILNITPDSFYDGNKNLRKSKINQKFNSLIQADIIDIGCESSKPGSSPVSLEEELFRLEKSFSIVDKFPDKKYSIDTTKYEVAKVAVDHGFKYINDISSGRNDQRIFNLSASNDSKIILMHMIGTPKTMQLKLKKITINSMVDFFSRRIEVALKCGVQEQNIIIDPGIGFGKSLSDNYKILNNLDKLVDLNYPLLLGISRKSFLKYEHDNAKDRLSATLGVSSLAVQMGVEILRVHDVLETKKMLHAVEKVICN